MKGDVMLWVAVAAVMAATSVTSVKAYTQTSGIQHACALVLSVVTSGFLLLAYYEIFQRGQALGSMYATVKILDIVFVLALGVLVFREHVTAQQALGIGIGALAIFLIAS